ncbi:hypothetical protein ABIC37_001052 [Priestia megaterium]|nr:hypothetical protein [Priestia megaterium]
MIGGQGEDSCGNSGTDETQRPPAESEALHGNQLRCNKQSSSSISFVHL